MKSIRSYLLLWLVGGLLVAVRTFRWRNKADG